jgi:phage gpG-like protein
MANQSDKIRNKIKQLDMELTKATSAMGILAKNHFTKSFANQGFTNEHLEAWKQRKASSRKQRSRAILVQTGRLRRSINSRRSGKFQVTISTDVPYAKVHNEGGRSGRGRGFQMPKRQFIGDSKILNRQIETKINQKIKTWFNR